MSEAEGPVYISAKAVAEVNGKLTSKSVTFSFNPIQGPLLGLDPKEPNRKRVYILAETLDKVRDAGSAPVDGRLDRIGRLVCDSFDQGKRAICSIDITLPGGIRRRFEGQIDIVRLIGNLTGMRAERTKAGSTGKMGVTIRYTKTGGIATLTETFGLDETIVRGDGFKVDLERLANKLKRAGTLVPLPP